MKKLTRELIIAMSRNNISIHKVMIGITENAVVDLDVDAICFDDMSYNVLDSTPPLSHCYEVRHRGELIYDKVGASDRDIIEFIDDFIAKGKGNNNVQNKRKV